MQNTPGNTGKGAEGLPPVDHPSTQSATAASLQDPQPDAAMRGLFLSPATDATDDLQASKAELELWWSPSGHPLTSAQLSTIGRLIQSELDLPEALPNQILQAMHRFFYIMGSEGLSPFDAWEWMNWIKIKKFELPAEQQDNSLEALFTTDEVYTATAHEGKVRNETMRQKEQNLGEQLWARFCDWCKENDEWKKDIAESQALKAELKGTEELA